MFYAAFIIFKEDIFLRKVFLNEELTKTDSMKDVKTHHKNFVRFLQKNVVFLQNACNNYNVLHECFNDDLLDFCKSRCADCSDFNELK